MNDTPGPDPSRARPDKPLAFLARLANELTMVLSFDELLDGTLTMLAEEAGFDSCTVGLIDEPADTITLVRAVGIRADYTGLIVPRGRSLNWTVAESGAPLYVPDMCSDPRVYRLHDNIGSGIYAPLTVRRRVIGVLSAHRSAADAFGPEDLDVLTVVARYLAGAIEVARLYEQLRELANTDELTRLPNRRSILERFAAELGRAGRDAQALSVAVVDLDNLKRINDTRGHQTGDRVLAQMADWLRRRTRAHDVVGRLAGDEFILLFPNTDRGQAESIMRRVGDLEITAGAPGPMPTLSWGVATWPEDGVEIDTLMAVADRHLYAMKRAHLAERPSPGGGSTAPAAHDTVAASREDA